jgi:serine/threonine protein kinase
MVMTSVNVLADALRETGLLRPEQLRQLTDEFAPRYEDLQDLARHVIKLGWLTVYQAKKLLTGHGAELVVGNFIILDKIGEGGMGKVYKARQTRLNRLVALKVIRPDLLRNDVALKRFQREARAAARLAHPNIVRLFDADQAGDRHFLAMEYVRGTDLAGLVHEHGPLSVGRSCALIRQAALGLQHAHGLGMTHRDIKPSNILVARPSEGARGEPGVVKILDMGLARMGEAADKQSELTALTQAGTVVGTPDYMSPEQGKNSSNVDARSDLYSLGCTFYFLLAGRPPFPGGSTLEKLLHHQMDAPAHIQLLRPEVPNAVAAVLHKLLAKRPEDRFENGGALAKALERWCKCGLEDSRLGKTVADAKIEPFVQALPVVEELPCDEPAKALEEEADPFAFDDPSPEDASEDARTKPDPEEQVRKRRPLWHFAGIAAGIGLLVGGIVAARIMFAKKESTSSPEAVQAKETDEPRPPAKKEPAGWKHEPEPVDAFLPADTAGVFVLNVPSLAKSPFFKARLQPLLDPALAAVQLAAKFDPLKSVDRVVVAFPSSGEGMIIVQGRDFLTSDLLNWLTREAKGRRTEERVPGGETHAVYELHFKAGEAPTYLAILNLSPATVALSADKTRVVEALGRADAPAAGKAKAVADPSIAAAVAKYDPKASALWGCLSTQVRLPGKGTLASEFGVLGISVGVRVGEGMDFDAYIEAGTPREALSFFHLMQEVLGKNLGKNADPRVVRLVEMVTKSKAVPPGKFGGRGAAPYALHVHRYLTADELNEWIKPFLEGKP